MALQVIGAGLGRTGTMSLKMALEQLGFSKCHHMAEIFLNPDQVPLWLAAADGEADWDAVYEGYLATVDYPGCYFWSQLVDAYPDAKVLLSIRDADSWFDSTQASIFSDANIERSMSSPIADFFARTVFEEFGDNIHDRAFMTDYFRNWNAEVEASVPPERLLVYEVKQGWEPLCTFLGVDVPDTAFPRSNSREEFQAMLAQNENMDPDEARAQLKEKLGGD